MKWLIFILCHFLSWAKEISVVISLVHIPQSGARLLDSRVLRLRKEVKRLTTGIAVPEEYIKGCESHPNEPEADRLIIQNKCSIGLAADWRDSPIGLLGASRDLRSAWNWNLRNRQWESGFKSYTSNTDVHGPIDLHYLKEPTRNQCAVITISRCPILQLKDDSKNLISIGASISPVTGSLVRSEKNIQLSMKNKRNPRSGVQRAR
jgi:hypothetical protein